MLLSPDFFNSLNENFIQTDGCWAWSTEDVYSIGYKELLVQPINLNTISLDYFRFKTPTTEIIIRYGTTSGAPLIFQGLSYNINEFEDTKSHNELLGLQGGDVSGNYYHVSSSTFGYLSAVSANVQDQINTTNTNLQTSSTSLQNQINTLAQQSISGIGAGTVNRIGKFVTSGSLGNSTIFDDGSVVKIYNSLSASGNVSGNSFVKIGGTSNQFLKADGSVDSNVYITSSSLTPYTLLTTTSAISANLQTQISNNNNKLSAYLPLSGGNVYGLTTFGNSSNNGYITLRTNNTSAGQTDLNYSITSAGNSVRRFVQRYDVATDRFDLFYCNDSGSPSATIMRVVRDSTTPTYFYKGVRIDSGSFNIQTLSASKLVATDSSKNLISYILTSADMPGVLAAISNLPNAEGCLKNTGSGAVSWEKALPIQSYSTLGMSNFSGLPVYMYEPLSGRGLGFTDSRTGNWRGGLVSTSAAFGIHQDATSTSSFKPFQISDGAGNVWYSQDPLNSIKHIFTGTGRFSSTLSANSFVKSGGTSTQFLKADGSVDSNVYITSSSLSPYTLLTTTSAISANLQSQINNDKNSLSAYALTTTVSAISGNLQSQINTKANSTSLSAYLPLSGGTMTGQLNALYVSANGGFLVRKDAPDPIQIYRPTSGVTTTFGQTFEANNNAGQKVIYSRILNSIDSAVSGLHTGSIYFKVYKNGVEQTPVQILADQLKMFGTISASGNITAPQFNGNLNGYKNVDNTNECTIANGFSSNQPLFINYRGATSAITEYRFCNGLGATYSGIRASAFIKDGGTSTQFLKADGSVDTNVYTTTATTSAISASLQSQINTNNNKLSAYLPLSGGTLTGQLIAPQISATGDVYADRHIVFGGLSTQFLKADGSIDSNSYALDTLGSYYLPLSGGVMTGEIDTQTVRPVAPFAYNLGTSFFPYLSIYSSAANFNLINMEGSIIPVNSFSYDLGSNANRWSTIYTRDLKSVAINTVVDRNAETVDVKSHILIGFDNQLAPHLNFSQSLGISANLSGDFYFDGSFLKIRDKNLVLKTLAYTSDLSAYTPTSGFTQTISAYLPLSGGTLTGQLRGTTVSASGNISGNSFVKNGGTSAQFLKANGTIDSNVYTTTATTSAISASLQSQITTNKNGLSAYLPLSGGTLSGDILFADPGLNIFRGIGGTIGTDDWWYIKGRADSYDNGFLEIATGDGGTEPIYVTQYKTTDPPSSRTLTLLDPVGNSIFPGNLSATGVSANNFVSNSSIIMQNTAKTADKIKIFDNLIQMRSGVSDPFVQLSASLVGTSGVFLNVSTANPSYPAILKSDIGLMTSGFGVNGKTDYLKSIPTISAADGLTNRVAALQTILENYGLIKLI